MSTKYTRSRIENYFVDLLDIQDQKINRLKTTSNGSLSFDATAEVKAGGSIEVLADGTNWIKHRLQIWYQLNNDDPTSLGIYIPTAPKDAHNSGTIKVSLELHDKLIILQGDVLDSYFSVPQNAVITDTIKSILESAGQFRYAITGSTQTLTEPLFWEPNTSKLAIINELLRYINYEDITVDEQGIFTVRPYALPAQRPLVWTFAQGAAAIHKGEWSRESNISEIPNKVVLVADGSDEEEALIGRATNTDPSSDLSFENLGRWVVHFESGVDAESPDIINELAYRKLIELSSPYSSYDVEHAVVPIKLNDVVRFISTNTDVTATVERIDYTLTPGSLCSTTWREVINL